MTEDKTICHTPTPGKKPTRIPTWKYQAIRDAILKIVPKKESGIVAKELPTQVAELLQPEVKTKLGSVTWHTTCVKLNMEVEGELRRVAKLKPQHLVKV